jgi:hypothetical protein
LSLFCSVCCCHSAINRATFSSRCSWADTRCWDSSSFWRAVVTAPTWGVSMSKTWWWNVKCEKWTLQPQGTYVESSSQNSAHMYTYIYSIYEPQVLWESALRSQVLMMTWWFKSKPVRNLALI